MSRGTSSFAVPAVSPVLGAVPCALIPSRSRSVALRASSGSNGSWPPKIERNTRSNALTCAVSVTNTARAVQYSLLRDTGSTRSSARANAAPWAGVVGRPASRRRRANVVETAARSSPIVSNPKSVTAAHELLEAGRADHLLVLAVLQYRTERALDRFRVEVLDAEQVQSRQPVD